MMSLDDYKQGNFNQEQEEAGLAVEEALGDLADALGINSKEKFVKDLLIHIDTETRYTLASAEADA